MEFVLARMKPKKLVTKTATHFHTNVKHLMEIGWTLMMRLVVVQMGVAPLDVGRLASVPLLGALLHLGPAPPVALDRHPIPAIHRCVHVLIVLNPFQILIALGNGPIALRVVLELSVLQKHVLEMARLVHLRMKHPHATLEMINVSYVMLRAKVIAQRGVPNQTVFSAQLALGAKTVAPKMPQSCVKMWTVTVIGVRAQLNASASGHPPLSKLEMVRNVQKLLHAMTAMMTARFAIMNTKKSMYM